MSELLLTQVITTLLPLHYIYTTTYALLLHSSFSLFSTAVNLSVVLYIIYDVNMYHIYKARCVNINFYMYVYDIYIL